MKIDINKIVNGCQSLTNDDREFVNKNYFNDNYGYRGIPVVFKNAFKSENESPSGDHTEAILNIFRCWLSEEKFNILSEEKDTFSALDREEFSKDKWNYLLSGRKLWLIYPATFNAEISNNRSKYHVEDIGNINEKISENLIKPFYAIQEPGDLIYIPGNNYHMHINVEDTAAYQQNFINEINYDNVRIALRKGSKEEAKHLETIIKSNFEKLSQ